MSTPLRFSTSSVARSTSATKTSESSAYEGLVKLYLSKALANDPSIDSAPTFAKTAVAQAAPAPGVDYEAIATLALLPEQEAATAIQAWAAKDEEGLADSLEELPDQNVLDLVRYLKPVVVVRLLYQMQRGDLIAQHALLLPSSEQSQTFKAFDELVVKKEVAEPARARAVVVAFHQRWTEAFALPMIYRPKWSTRFALSNLWMVRGKLMEAQG